MSAQDLKLAIRGLYTSPNPFGASPRGSFSVADNCVIYYPGILESRRGFELHSTLASGSRLSSFQGKLIALAGTTLKYYNSGWNSLSGSYTAPTGTRMQFLESANQFFYTTNAGIYVLDTYSGTPRAAGVPQCIPSVVASFGSSDYVGWFPPDTNVAYRYVLGRYLPDGTPQLGPPSPRVIFQNNSVINLVTTHYIPLPTGIATAGMFIRLYRSEPSLDTSTAPDDELFQSIEYVITAQDITNGYVDQTTLIDGSATTGAALYTNASQEGIAAANYPPPLAKGLCNYKNTTIYFNGEIPQTFLVRLMSTTDPSNTSLLPGDTVTFSDGTNSDLYTAVASAPTTAQFQVETATVGARGPIDRTLTNLAFRILTDLKSGASDVPLRPYVDPDANTITFSAPAPGGPQLTMTVGTTTYTLASNALTRAADVVTVTQSNHPYRQGALVNMAASIPDANFPVGVKTVFEDTDANHWKYLEVGANATSAQVYTATHYLPAQAWSPQPSATANFSDSTDVAAIYYSKDNQPNAVPLDNNDTVGIAMKAVKAVVPLRESVLIYKEDGLYRLTGNSPEDFIITPYDLSTVIAAPDTAVSFKDNSPFLGTRGGEYASESTGISQLADGGMDETFLTLLAQNSSLPSLAFGVSYEAEEQYFLWLPAANDTTAPIDNCYVFHADANAWTRWPVSASHAIIDPATGKLTLVNGSTVWVERKGYVAADYQDIGGSDSISLVTSQTQITLAGPNAGVGDLITQGGNTARIITLAGSVATVYPAKAWSTGAITYQKAIDCTATWLPAAGENPGTTKQFREQALDFRLGSFDFITAYFATDVTPTSASVIRYGRSSTPYNMSIRTIVPQNMQRAVMLTCGFQHKQALCNFQLQSSSLIYRQTSTRTPTHGEP